MIGAPRWVRRSLRSARLRAVLCWMVHLYIRFVYATNRWTVEGEEWPRRFCHEHRGFIVAFWHGRLMMLPKAWPGLAPFHMLISSHRDGRIIADVVSYFGIHSIPGSTRRGGSAALRRMLKQIEAGGCVGITPDGPRGPAMVASAGIVNLARLTGAPIVPIVCATSRRTVWNSWDRFNIALPFGRGIFIWGEPIEIASDLDASGLERARLLVETRMNEMAREADRGVGHKVGHKEAAPGIGQSDPAQPREGTGGGPRPLSGAASDYSPLAAENRLPAGERQRS